MTRKNDLNVDSNKININDEGYSSGRGSARVANNGDNDRLKRDLSLGGAVLLGVGAKQLLLPALSLSHPLLLAVTVPTTLVTGKRYLSRLWGAVKDKEPITMDVLAGGAMVAAVLSGGSVAALAGVGALNLGKYLGQNRPVTVTVSRLEEEPEEAQNQPTTPSWPHSFTHYAIPASLVASSLVFAPHFIGLMPSMGTSLMVTNELAAFLRTTPYAPWLYIGAQAARPPILPATLLTIAGGLLFGPSWGILYTVAGSTISAIIGYGVGRYLGERVTVDEGQEVMQGYAEKMRENPFESVFIMRMLFLPYDLVNYLAGALQIDGKSFILATVLGSLPGTISLVLLGASVEGNLLQGAATLNPATLAASGVIFISSLALSRYIKSETEPDEEKGITGDLGMA